MSKSKSRLNVAKIDESIAQLNAMTGLFDTDDVDLEDREEMQAQADVLAGLLLKTGLVERSPNDEMLSLDYIVRAMRTSEVRKKAAAVRRFYRALSSYNDDDDLSEAQEALGEFGSVLMNDLIKAKQK